MNTSETTTIRQEGNKGCPASVLLYHNYMKIFKTVPMGTWEIGMVKFTVGTLGIAIGATWPNIFAPYTTMLFVAGILVGLYIFYAWAKK